jgi:hypothetical protein
VYWGIVLLEDGIPYGVMNTFKDWKKMVFKKLDICTLVDLFDNKKTEGSTLPAPKTTPNHQGNPLPLSCWCNAVFEPLFRRLSKYPNLPP